MHLLTPLDDDVWLADGPVVRFLGLFPYPTRMAVVRLRDGGLWLWSPIAWSEALGRELAALGPVQHLVAPNKLHHLYLEGWAQRCPGARLYAAPGLARKRSDLRFDAELGDAPETAWQGQIEQVVFRGSLLMEEVVFFHRASRVAFVCDLIQRFDPATLSGWRRALMRADGLVGLQGSTPREWRASFVSRRRARQALEEALSWEPRCLVIAHGVLPQENGREALELGLHWLRQRARS